MTSNQIFFPCVTFGQFSLFLISRLGVFILENKEKTPGFLLHSFVIRFISNHSTSYHGYKRNDHEPNIFFRALCLDNFHYFLFSLWEWLFSRTKKKKKKQVFYFTHSSSGSSPTTGLVTMVTNVCLTCRITRINQYQSSWFTVQPGLIYGFLHFTDVKRPVIFFFQIIRDLSRKISFSAAIISWVITLMDSNLHESLIDIRPSSILIFSSVKFYLSNNEALRHKE